MMAANNISKRSEIILRPPRPKRVQFPRQPIEVDERVVASPSQPYRWQLKQGSTDQQMSRCENFKLVPVLHQ